MNEMNEKKFKKGFLKGVIDKKHKKELTFEQAIEKGFDWAAGYSLALDFSNKRTPTKEIEEMGRRAGIYEMFSVGVPLPSTGNHGTMPERKPEKKPVQVSELPSYRFGYIERAPIEDVFWKPSTQKELAEGLATLGYFLPRRAIPFFWKELTKSQGLEPYPTDPHLLREYVDFMWGVGFSPEPSFDPEKEYARLTGKDLPRNPVADKMTPYMRDPRISMFKKSNIPVPAVSSLPRWQESGVPVTQEDLALLAYSYGMDQMPDKIATVWDTAFYIAGDVVNSPDWVFDPTYSTEYQGGNDPFSGQSVHLTNPEGLRKNKAAGFGAVYGSTEGK